MVRDVAAPGRYAALFIALLAGHRGLAPERRKGKCTVAVMR
jgi:hypothetical protein